MVVLEVRINTGSVGVKKSPGFPKVRDKAVDIKVFNEASKSWFHFEVGNLLQMRFY